MEIADGTGSSAGPFDRYPATSKGIAAAADDLAASAARIDLVADAVRRERDRAVAGVAGRLTGPLRRASRTCRRRSRGVYLAAQCAAGATRGFGRAVGHFNREVDRLNTVWAASVAGHFGVPSPSPDAARTPGGCVDRRLLADLANAHTNAVADARAALLARLRRRYLEAEAQLDAAAGEAAGQLDAGPTDQVLRQMFAAGLLPYRMLRDYPGAGLEAGRLPYDLARMPADELAAWLIDRPGWDGVFALPRRVVEALGVELAGRIRRVVGDPDSISAVDDLLRRLRKIGGVDGAFVDALGGADLLDVVSELTVHATMCSADTAAALSLIGTLKAAAGSATDQLPTRRQRELADELTRALPRGLTGGTGDDNHVVLAYLLRDGRYDTAFLDRMGADLDGLERDEGYGPERWTNLGVGSPAADLLYDGDDPAGAYDPMAGYLSALGNNGEAALNFFAGGDGLGADSRAEHYLHDRAWAQDGFDGALAALDSAATDPDNLVGRGHEAGELTSYAVHYLTGHDEFEPGALGDDAARRLAHLVGTYMAAVDYANAPPFGPGTSGLGVHNLDGREDLRILRLGDSMPVFDSGELDELLRAGVSSEAGFLALRGAVSHYQNLHLATVLEHVRDRGFDEDDGMWAQATHADARLEGTLMDSLGEVRIADGVERDDQIKAWIALGQRLAYSGSGANGIKPFTQIAVSLAGMKLEDTLATHEAQEMDRANEVAADAMTVRGGAILEQLYDAGVVTDHDLHDAARHAGLSDAAFHELFPPARRDPGSMTAGAVTGLPQPSDSREFPDAQALLAPDRQRLRDMVGAVVSAHVDSDEWRQSYEHEFHKHFE